jgi:transcriptional regulator with XRE-family HTH domain
MDFGNKILQLRKEKDFSRDELAKMVSTSGAIIGRYERNEITPSVDVAAKLANALDVSLDYLVGNTELVFDKAMLNRIQEVSKMDDDDKKQVFLVIDALIRDCKAKKAYGR